MAKEKKEKGARDDFKPALKLLLRNLCGGVCSNPECRAYTFGANQEDKGSFSSIGVAAHITAAASGPGARRYDPAMTPDERMSAANGIWLCQSCSKLIDTDEVRYPVELLHEWKRQAETRAMKLIGQQSFGPAEMQTKLVEAVAGASQIFYTNAGDFTKVPLAGFVAGYENYLSQLDPRFEVKTVATGSNVRHEVRVRPGQIGKVDIVFTDPDEAAYANAGWERFLETGEHFEISTKSFEFKGSALFDLMNNRAHEGTFTLEPHKSIAPATLYLKSLEHDTEFEIASFDAAYFSAGDKLFISGDCLSGLITFKMTYNAKSLQVTFDYNFKPEKWVGEPLVNLPHLPKLQKLANFLVKDNQSKIVIEFNLSGHVLRFGEEIEQNLSGLYSFIIHVVDLMNRAKVLAKHINEKLRVESIDISEKDEKLIGIYYKVITSGLTIKEPVGKDLFTVHNPTVSDTQLTDMNTNGFTSYLKLKNRNAANFDFFGNDVSPPIFQTVITGFEGAFFTDITEGERIDALKLYAVEGSTTVHSLED
ncbi:hypothetical protein ALO82_200054 [Pseudomonas syringae pv. broussonetiae]|uniref:HNH endonuclease n=1 Tax=Pseudomonas savastanoi TaxID=29438 RepID=A0A3M5JEZ1_PSESS|nr:hypothetical protein [Pseudomonas savastanoi]KPW62907.1 hypothetical protein ALO82_200054 [Pseudomonas syringae pv. broussonetiae]KWT09455.1 hypothetical protein AL047_16425 [Pseudomonas syringae pv. broussonetiae]RMS29776.1 hypothetical protein ALP70_02806 [Pseudomonas savastanoi]RMT21958.1 hypothetical protein ALP51_00894 [Pseudomonas savastanoi]